MMGTAKMQPSFFGGGGGRATSRDVITKPNLKIRARSGVEALLIFLGLRTKIGGF